jgi:hypothetical protein
MTHRLIVTCTLALILCSTGVEASPTRALAPLGFLIGEWRPEGAGQPGVATGTATFALGLQGRVITRKSFAAYPASPGKAAYRHDDLMIIYAADSTTVRADYFDNEGHVIHYRVTSAADSQATFVSEIEAAAPRYRLTYTLTPDSLLKGRFEIAPPGKPDAFAEYLAWTSRRVVIMTSTGDK